MVEHTQDTGGQDQAADQQAAQDAAAATAAGKAQATTESFIDPASLPDELKPHWKRMHTAFSKRMGEFNTLSDKAALVDRFQTDGEFALQTIQQVAAQLGYTLSRPSASSGQGQVAAPASDVPPQLVQAVKGRLSPELQWMAESIASAQWEAHKLTAAPLQQQAEADRRSQRLEEYDQTAEELTEAAPGWEVHEEEMLDLLNFLESDAMTHRRWGSKLALLHNLATSNSAAIAEANRRQAQAVRSRTTAGASGRTSAPSTSERVLKPESTHEAWKEAGKIADEEIRRLGLAVPQ